MQAPMSHNSNISHITNSKRPQQNKYNCTYLCIITCTARGRYSAAEIITWSMQAPRMSSVPSNPYTLSIYHQMMYTLSRETITNCEATTERAQRKQVARGKRECDTKDSGKVKTVTQ